MGRAPCCDKANVKKGPWSPEEDAKLKAYIQQHGTGGNWIALPHKIGLKRCGKSCRLRWLNYLRPNIKHGGFSEEEDNIICSLYVGIGSRWSIIAAQLPGRTDNDIKNYWNTRLKKKLLGKQRKQQEAQVRRPNNNNIIKQELIKNQTTITPLSQDHHNQLPQYPSLYECDPSFFSFPQDHHQYPNNNGLMSHMGSNNIFEGFQVQNFQESCSSDLSHQIMGCNGLFQSSYGGGGVMEPSLSSSTTESSTSWADMSSLLNYSPNNTMVSDQYQEIMLPHQQYVTPFEDPSYYFGYVQ